MKNSQYITIISLLILIYASVSPFKTMTFTLVMLAAVMAVVAFIEERKEK